MPVKSLRRLIALAGLVMLTGGTMAFAAVPAQAATVVQLSVFSPTVRPGDTVTVTQTITNANNFVVLDPSVRLFSAPYAITSYTSPMSCTGTTNCTVVNGPDGPVGYQALLPQALGAGASATVTFTFQIFPTTPDLVVTLQGQLSGSNYVMDRVNGPVLTVDAAPGAVMFVAATPQSGTPQSGRAHGVAELAIGPEVSHVRHAIGARRYQKL